jgi:hypothetical protein
LESEHRVIGAAHDDDVSIGLSLAPQVHPAVEDVMQIDIDLSSTLCSFPSGFLLRR